MKTCRTLFATAVISTVLAVSGGTAFAQDACAPGFANAFNDHAVAYNRVLVVVQPRVPVLTALLKKVVDQTSYDALLSVARSMASSIPNGRIVIAVPDGTVVIDTARPDDPGNTLPQGNSYQHYQTKTVNENHNSRVAIFSAQLYPCGIGVESKLSTTTGNIESYLALRLGKHLDNEGTVRGSTY